jgi:hypothetical protein
MGTHYSQSLSSEANSALWLEEKENSNALFRETRALGLRSIISQGWGNLRPIDTMSDCLAVDDLSHEKLFPRVERRTVVIGRKGSIRDS